MKQNYKEQKVQILERIKFNTNLFERIVCKQALYREYRITMSSTYTRKLVILGWPCSTLLLSAYIRDCNPWPNLKSKDWELTFAQWKFNGAPT